MSKRKQKRIRKPRYDDDLMFVFRYANVFAELTDEDTENTSERLNEINNAIQILTREIRIDKTYVGFPDSKYEKFIFDEDEWKDLCTLEAETNYGKNATELQHAQLLEFYAYMIISYVNGVLYDMGFDMSDTYVYMTDKSKFMLEIYSNPVKNDNYNGKWQTW